MALVMNDTKTPYNNAELYNIFEVKMEHIAKNLLLSKVNDTDNVLMEVQAIIEKIFIGSAMKLSKNNISKAAKLLGINRNTLAKKLRNFGI
jgi:DNA-binding protein Fis